MQYNAMKYDESHRKAGITIANTTFKTGQSTAVTWSPFPHGKCPFIFCSWGYKIHFQREFLAVHLEPKKKKHSSQTKNARRQTKMVKCTCRFPSQPLCL